ncbi:hypothetical protein PF005_g5932 [Phytophthora fragariae]|uniref:Cwf18 pre-mRNA splicing factor n=1 Tax=Phytophthora fragariae TaxID=53985 RepID=A0A6A3T943_9STRA|nr:hypothetical protein PF003_g4432 [Phytophthora fragariae]KAE8943717.1 hypothetical protein PF009_g6554 [Phytophthora fragariae]KAE9026860.1 hypothetical protein PF011_g2331 [Phytophthora fragariae]KAE9126286.1 hypothetical protein PF007_g6032 [Phytophthora fragariae]KAE9127207.1 hypothetical protein PF010_g4991 [Phytophthora fragariae]
MPDGDDAMPRAKRLKLLREAKARKERGESSNGEAGALVAAALKPVTDEPMQQEESEGQPKEQQDAEMTAVDADKADESVQGLVEKVANAQEVDVKTEDESDDELLNLAPKRANWDMERDIAPMLRKLERRTQHAIVEILREKLAAEQQEEDDEEDDEEVEDEEVDE